MKAVRLVGVLAALLLAASTLSACQPRVGVAGVVGSTSISESQVAKYVSDSATLSSSVDSSTGETVYRSPKSQVLSFLILEKLLNDALERVGGGTPTKSALAAGLAEFLTNGGGTEQQFEASVVKAGYDAAFAPIYIDANVKFGLLGTALKAQTSDEIFAAINKLHVRVSVNPRYGTWDAAQLNVTTGPASPSFLKIKSPVDLPTDASSDDGTSG